MDEVKKYNGFLTFQIEKIEGNIATGAVKEKTREPDRDDFFRATGEVEFGGGYMATGNFNDDAFDYAKKVWRFQSYPIGKYHERSFEIPDGIKLKPGQFVRVKYAGELNSTTTLVFHKDRLGANISVKKFKTFEEDKKATSYWR